MVLEGERGPFLSSVHAQIGNDGKGAEAGKMCPKKVIARNWKEAVMQ